MKRLFAIIIVLAVGICPAFSQKKEVYRVRTVVIDPGHGGAKPGAHGVRSQEKDITLAIAKKFGKLISDNYSDVKVIYTRTTDVDISLAQRARIANSNKADLFISIHANSHPTTSPTGVETFVMGLSESRANLEVAKKENADILLEADYKTNADYSGFDPNAPESYVMLTMFQHAFLDKSLDFAQAIQSQYKRNLKTINRGVKQAELYVLYKTTCPSVLTEVGFISNPTEEAFMLSDEGQAKIAVSLFNAFMAYKASEEGTKVLSNPVINIKGYKDPAAKPAAEEPAPVAKKEEPKQAEPAKAEPLPAQAVATAEVKAVAEEAPVVEREPVAPATSRVLPPEPPAPVPVDTLAALPVPLPVSNKPLPSVNLVAAQESQNDAPAVSMVGELTPAEMPTPAPEAETAAETTPAAPVEPVAEQPAVVAEQPTAASALVAPRNSAGSDGQYYTVQFLTAMQHFEAGDKELGGITEFEIYRKGELYCYTTGRFATFQEAQRYCEDVQTATRFKDAWALLRRVEQSAPQNNAAANSGERVSYRVQFCTSTRELKAGDPALGGVKDYHSSQTANGYVYTAGDYATQQEAQRRCNELRKGRFKDAFVIAIYKGQRITLDEAKRIGR